MSKSYPPWVSPLLEKLKAEPNMAQACRDVGVAYSVMMALKTTDADFAAAVEEAQEEAFDYMEAEARRRAFQGVEKPVVYQGQLTPVFERDAAGNVVFDTRNVQMPDGKSVTQQIPRQARNADGSLQWLSVREYSDSMAMFLLKGYRRRRFGDKVEMTGKDGGPLAMVDETKRVSRLAALMDLARSRKNAEDLT